MEIAAAYVRLAHAIQQHFPGYIDAYFGPGEWAHAEKRPLAELRAEAHALLAAAQGLPGARGVWLAAQARAMQTTLAMLDGEDVPFAQGERLPFAEEVRRLYEVEPAPVSESRFEAAIAALDAALPGHGPVHERMAALRERFTVPPERVGAVVEAVLRHLRGPVVERFGLPEGEGFEVRLVKGQPWGAYNWYLGGFRSRIDLNTDLPTHLHALPDTLAHEGYPGHHTEHLLKELRLYREKGHAEASVQLLCTPECVISEGVAMWARKMVLSDQECDALILELAPLAGVSVGPEEVAAMREAARHSGELRYVNGNAALLLHGEGRPAEEVRGYIQRYALATPERAEKSLEFVRTWRSYVFTYTAGADLLGELFAARGGREEWFGRLLTEAVTPGTVRGWIAGAAGGVGA